MSLCPDYCAHESCIHHFKFCEPCEECIKASERLTQQHLHQLSVRKQRQKLKKPKWKEK